MDPRALLRRRDGRLYEIPLLILFVLLSITIGFGERSWWKGPVYAGGGLFALLVGVGLFVEAVDRLAELPLVRRVLDSGVFALAVAEAVYAAGAAGGAAALAFTSIFLAPAASSTPEGQLLFMRAAVAVGLVGGVVLVRLARRAPPRF